MEYEFRKDFITRKPAAHFSFDHEVFGPWLEVEIGSDNNKLSALFDFINGFKQQNSQDNNALIGQEYSLFLFDDEVEIRANIEDIEQQLPDVLIDDVDGFEQNTQACCGLEDFLIMLESWQEFIA